LIVLELPEMPYSAIFACLPARLHLPYSIGGLLSTATRF
jgi:hypothetical protein